MLKFVTYWGLEEECPDALYHDFLFNTLMADEPKSVLDYFLGLESHAADLLSGYIVWRLSDVDNYSRRH